MLNSKLPQIVKHFCQLLESIPERDRLLLIERFSRGKSMKQVSEQFNITAERVRQIEDPLIDIIYERLESKSLKK